ncbi:MAG: DUF116 domain-containing protein [Deltaproteobacteria bacterium]|nr:DUF116 domain-containing protein [Candidatus Anaeroferrophillacea bacterium]
MLQPSERILTARKRIFLGLLILAFTILLVLVTLLGWVGTVGLRQIHPLLPAIGLTVSTVGFAVLSGIMVLLVLTIMLERELPFTRNLRGLVIKVFLPVMVFIGRLLGIPRDTVNRSFIEINNQLVLSRHLKVAPDRLLILLPHCLQDADCQRKITTRISNCARCGRCVIDELLALAERYGTRIAVATGGTLARKIVRDYRPRVIIAVACERDLTSGLHDTYPLPVYGILNRRPHGPCWNTTVDVARVEHAVKTFIDHRPADALPDTRKIGQPQDEPR